MKVIVIGGGPAGMMSAISSAENGNDVTIIEKMQSLGRKLLITGKGRCNITSSLDMDEFIKNIPGNGMFLYSAFKNYTNQDIIKLLKEEGLEVKEERGNRIFPVTDKSLDVLKCFEKKLKSLNVNIILNTKVKEILVEDNIVKGVKTEKEIINADKVILATGGKSYPLTGSTGDGYVMAQKLGHTVTKINPSLVPLEAFDKETCKNLQGLSSKNVKIELIDKNKVIVPTVKNVIRELDEDKNIISIKLIFDIELNFANLETAKIKGLKFYDKNNQLVECEYVFEKNEITIKPVLKEVSDETGDTVEKTTFSIYKITYAEESFIFDNNFIVNNIAVVPFIVVIK